MMGLEFIELRQETIESYNGDLHESEDEPIAGILEPSAEGAESIK